MRLIKLIRAFLAARYPAAYPEAAILGRINRSGMLDSPCTAEDLHKALLTLAQRHGHAELLTDVDGAQAWSATPAGVSAWTVDGSPAVGG